MAWQGVVNLDVNCEEFIAYFMVTGGRLLAMACMSQSMDCWWGTVWFILLGYFIQLMSTTMVYLIFDIKTKVKILYDFVQLIFGLSGIFKLLYFQTHSSILNSNARKVKRILYIQYYMYSIDYVQYIVRKGQLCTLVQLQ